jgi:hypothetical protein
VQVESTSAARKMKSRRDAEITCRSVEQLLQSVRMKNDHAGKENGSTSTPVGLSLLQVRADSKYVLPIFPDRPVQK